jgi:hypothetical protein
MSETKWTTFLEREECVPPWSHSSMLDSIHRASTVPTLGTGAPPGTPIPFL